MKKFLALFLVLVLSLGLMLACNDNVEEPFSTGSHHSGNETNPNGEQSTQPQDTQPQDTQPQDTQPQGSVASEGTIVEDLPASDGDIDFDYSDLPASDGDLNG